MSLDYKSRQKKAQRLGAGLSSLLKLHLRVSRTDS
jgi:hypothetical protein